MLELLIWLKHGNFIDFLEVFNLIDLNTQYLEGFISENDILSLNSKLEKAHDLLHDASLNCSNGWLNWPIDYDENEFQKIKSTALKIQKNSDVFIVIGIGGSYLGSSAALRFLHNSVTGSIHNKCNPEIIFVGTDLSGSKLNRVINYCSDKDVSINVISKSGNTLESAIAFRILRNFMIKKYGKSGAQERIYCTTDSEKGILKKIALQEGYECFTIPKNIGGRYSVLTAVGLLPIAVSGANIDDIITGAKDAYNDFLVCDVQKNACYKYAVIRNLLYNEGKSVEMISSFEPRFKTFFEWWKQLFGESEGKKSKGILPTSAIFSTDLHSMGQFIQDGSKILFETMVNVKNSRDDIIIESDFDNLDNLNYLSGLSLHHINLQALKGTQKAHFDGGVPIIDIKIDCCDEYNLGYLIYFFEKACAISAYILGVDPFNQPGVEAYKKNMFELLRKNNK